MAKALSVQFTGSTAVYPYLCNPVTHYNPTKGQRVVVPPKMKNDGTVTLTIGHIVNVHEEPPAAAVKPIIALLNVALIEEATEICKALEAAEAEAAAAAAKAAK